MRAQSHHRYRWHDASQNTSIPLSGVTGARLLYTYNANKDRTAATPFQMHAHSLREKQQENGGIRMQIR